MKPPTRRQSLVEEGLSDTVVRQLMNGKKASHRQHHEQQHMAGDLILSSLTRLSRIAKVRFMVTTPNSELSP